MSWYSDREPFDEHDPPYCKNCKGGNSYRECKRCEEQHRREEVLNDYDDVTRFCDIYKCEECPRYMDDCDGDPDNSIEEEEL